MVAGVGGGARVAAFVAGAVRARVRLGVQVARVDDELARAKARLELSLLQSLETMSGKAEQIGFYETVLGDPAAAFRRLEGYRRVSASDMRKAARRYLSGGGRTVVRVVPDKSAPADAPRPEAVQ